MIYEYWLAGIKEITDLKKQKLREVYGSGKAIYYIEETKLDKLRFLNEKDVAILKNAKKDTKLEEKWRRTEEKRIQFIPYFLKTYPEKLKYITDPPYALYVLGQLPDEKRKSAGKAQKKPPGTVLGTEISVFTAASVAGMGHSDLLRTDDRTVYVLHQLHAAG